MNFLARTDLDARKKNIWIHVLLWVACILSVLTYRYLVLHGLDFDGKTPVPLRANPRLPVLGMGVLITSLLFVGLAALSARRKAAWLLAAGVAAVCLSIGALLASVEPGKGSLAIRDRSLAPFNQPPNPLFALPVLFSNGDFHVDSSESQRLIKNLEIFGSCGRGRIYVRGFASSAKFVAPPDDTSDDLNKQLANARAREVQKVLWMKAKIKSTLAPPWENYDAMKADRRIIDLSDEGKRLLSREALNRRVEVFWENGSCQGPLPLPEIAVKTP
jgi:hypothetical protein